MLLYSVFDKRSGAYGTLFPAHNDADASRSVIVGIRANQAMFARFPEDYALYYVGEFSEKTAELSQTSPRPVAELAALKEADSARQE